MTDQRLKQQMDFLLEVDKEKNIFRQTHLSGGGRAENDAEHAWHMALMIYLLREYANQDFDPLKAIVMALIHDVVEIDAGDTYAYDDAGLATQQEREAKAARRIFGLLPQDQRDEMMALFREFEDYETPEARFAHVLDNLQPLMLNHANNGGDWRAHQVKKSQIYKRNAKTAAGSQTLWAYMEDMVAENVKKGNIRDE
ncbi:HD domain-containing protein [Evtepia sp.]|uniref:HD domain-containing protein n=1 Tax=Evtepia sp. TaxID=2773933 RepID=UPI003F13937A